MQNFAPTKLINIFWARTNTWHWFFCTLNSRRKNVKKSIHVPYDIYAYPAEKLKLSPTWTCAVFRWCELLCLIIKDTFSPVEIPGLCYCDCILITGILLGCRMWILMILAVLVNYKAIEEEMKKQKPRDTLILPLMKSTFQDRRMYIQNDATSVTEILQIHPALVRPAIVSLQLHWLLYQALPKNNSICGIIYTCHFISV